MFGLDGTLGVGRKHAAGRQLTKNEAFHVLSNRRRRYALHYLQQRDGAVELGELAEQVAAWENDTTVEGLASEDRKSVYISLHQSHLPKMDEIGVVEYDKDRNAVRLSDNADQLAIHLEVVPERHLPWSEFYVGLAAVCVALVTALWLEVYPLTMLPDLAWAAAITGAFVVAAAVHYYTANRMHLGRAGPPAEIDRE